MAALLQCALASLSKIRLSSLLAHVSETACCTAVSYLCTNVGNVLLSTSLQCDPSAWCPAEIEKFLKDTEDYLQKLTMRVAQAKVTETAAEVYQEALQEARAQELNEEEVANKAKEAMQEHMAENELLKQANTQAGDAQSRSVEQKLWVC